MRKILKNLLYVPFVLYMISLSIAVPFFNWQYANKHGFVSWILLGELVATAKSFVWPYYVFSSTPVNRYDSPDDNHFRNSKMALAEAMTIADKAGGVSELPPDLKPKFIDLLMLAIAEANQVQPSYLKKMHPDYPDMYKKKIIYGMSIILKGVETDNRALVLTGAFEFNEFADWLEAHQSEFSH